MNGAIASVPGPVANEKRGRLHIAALMSAFVLFLSGCVLIDVELEIDRNDEVTGSIAFGVAQNLYDESSLPREARLSEEFNSIEGVSVARFQEDGFIGERVTFDEVPIEVFAPDQDGSQLITLKRDGDFLRIGGVIDLSDLEGAENFGATTDYISIRIKVPGKVIASNGMLDEATNTISWSPSFGEELQISATVEAPPGGGFPIGLSIGIASAIVFSAGMFFYLRSSRKTPLGETDSVNPEEPNLQSPN